MGNITFVDKNDQVIGAGSKVEAISNGIIHRVVRIFVLNSDNQLLIQKRAPNVDVPNRWDQSAAGHVDEGEDYLTAAKRELMEETGVSGVALKELTKYYSEEADDSRLRKRFNMLYSATFNGEVKIDPSEVSGTRWVQLDELDDWMSHAPEEFTTGFILSYKEFKKTRV